MVIIMNGDKIRDEIIDLLKTKGINFEYLEHQETRTSEDSAKIRGTKLEEGAKALILKGAKTGLNFMTVVPANRKANLDVLSSEVGDNLVLESPGIILEKYGLEVGAIPPFGNLLNVPVFIDGKFVDNDQVSFNCGLRTCSIIMKSKDMLEVIGGKIGAYSK